jgi:hypothetical protein
MVLALHAAGVAIIRGADALAAPGSPAVSALARCLGYEQYVLLNRLLAFYPEFDLEPPAIYPVLREAGADDEVLYALLQARDVAPGPPLED